MEQLRRARSQNNFHQGLQIALQSNDTTIRDTFGSWVARDHMTLFSELYDADIAPPIKRLPPPRSPPPGAKPPPLPPKKNPSAQVAPYLDKLEETNQELQNKDIEWTIIFNDIVLHQNELRRKAIERYTLAQQFLFPEEQEAAQTFIDSMDRGFNNFVRRVLQDNSYIDFGSGKIEPIVGSHGRSSAIIHFLESTNRAINDFTRYVTNLTTPEAVTKKCADRPLARCQSPCSTIKSGRFSPFPDKCGFS